MKAYQVGLKTSFWEVLRSQPEGADPCYKQVVARFDRVSDATVFRDMKAYASTSSAFEVRMVQRAKL